MKEKIKKIIKNIFTKSDNAYMDYVGFIFKMVFWVVILFFALPFLAKLFISIFKADIRLGDFILLITAAFIIAYTYETQKMKEEIKKQSDTQIAPCLVIYFKAQDYKSRITIKNIGNGPAFYIEFEKIIIRLTDTKKTLNYDLSVDGSPILTSQEERSVMGEMKYNGENIFKNNDNNGLEWIDPRYTSFEFEFSITYYDMRNNKYESRIETGRNKLKLLSYKKLDQ